MPRGSHVNKWGPLANVAATWHPHGAGVEIAKASLARVEPGTSRAKAQGSTQGRKSSESLWGIPIPIGDGGCNYDPRGGSGDGDGG
ncbi:hypothetical protein Tco_0315675 [Tanacetum coccineum]